jgi:hypothetical protein
VFRIRIRIVYAFDWLLDPDLEAKSVFWIRISMRSAFDWLLDPDPGSVKSAGKNKGKRKSVVFKRLLRHCYLYKLFECDLI